MKFAIFRLLAYSGMHKGEALVLTWKEMNFKEYTNSKTTMDIYTHVSKNSRSKVMSNSLFPWNRSHIFQIRFFLRLNTTK